MASGTNDVANQAVFDIASQQDPSGDRTVGVITKCDISQHVNQVRLGTFMAYEPLSDMNR